MKNGFFVQFLSYVGSALLWMSSAIAADGGANLCDKGTAQVSGRDVFTVMRPVAAHLTLPLVIGLHGGFGTGQHFAVNSGLADESLARGFVSVYPDGHMHSWNAGHCCGPARDLAIDDVSFLDAVISTAIADCAQRGITIDEIYMMGHSNGAFMTYRYADEGLYKPRGIGAVAGAVGGYKPGYRRRFLSSIDPSTKVVAVHGELDTNVRFFGGWSTGADQPRYDVSYDASFNRVSDLMDASFRTQSGDVWISWNAQGGFAVYVVDEDAGHSYSGLGGSELTAGILGLWGLSRP